MRTQLCWCWNDTRTACCWLVLLFWRPYRKRYISKHSTIPLEAESAVYELIWHRFLADNEEEDAGALNSPYLVYIVEDRIDSFAIGPNEFNYCLGERTFLSSASTCHQVATFLRLKLTVAVSFLLCYAAKDLSVKFKPTPYSDHDKQFYSSNIFAIGSFFLQGTRVKNSGGAEAEAVCTTLSCQLR